MLCFVLFLKSLFQICILKTKIPLHFESQFVVYILDPVVQSIVSLTISLRHKFVKQISAIVTNTLLFFVEKM